VGQSLLKGTPFEAMLQGGLDDSLFEGVNDTHYTVPNFHLWAHYPEPNVPVLWWRSVGNTHTGYVMETLVDELAERAKADPIAYRKKLLAADSKKLHAVLDLLEQKSAWRKSLPQGHAAGVACHESFGTGVACAVEVSLDRGKPRIHRATVAVDCGTAVNPLSIAAQMQGGLAFGMSQLVPHGLVTLKEGRVEQRNWDGYRPPYMADAPMAVDVHIVPSTERPTGCGEPPVPVIAPAVANALTRLTGRRYRKLPIEKV
ncbi:MAG TPA: molybdopterin cofactor-binding domain-containing protein, partial [Terriglobales bacterium]|nr:molybdopterin cofactor-binding domain-containing protein [Terriglobales bacterium]